VDAWNVSGGQPILHVHQAGDGKPALNSRRAERHALVASGFQLANPEIKGCSQPEIEQQKCKLEGAAKMLRMIGEGAANQFLPCDPDSGNARLGSRPQWKRYARVYDSSRIIAPDLFPSRHWLRGHCFRLRLIRTE